MMSDIEINKVMIFMPPPLQKREGIMLCCCLLVSRSTNSYRSFSKQRLHLQKWNLAYRFIIRSSSVWGMIEKILTDVWPLDLEKWQLFAVSVYFLHRGLREGGTSVLQTSLVYEDFYTILVKIGGRFSSFCILMNSLKVQLLGLWHNLSTKFLNFLFHF